MKLLKFGGSSVGSPERILQVIEILRDYVEKKQLTAVVFSAFQGVTDGLISLGNKAVVGDLGYLVDIENLLHKHIDAVNELIPKSKNKLLIKRVSEHFDNLKEFAQGVYLLKELTPKTMDSILSFGERLSCIIIAEAMKHRGMNVEFLDARTIIKTDSNFSCARVDFNITNRRIKNYFKSHSKPQVVTGFIGTNNLGETTTLGRGGSDFTASILGAALKVKAIEIWTDVDGILTADPRKVENAYSINAVTYEEAMELSHFGAKVIYPPTMQPALEKKIKIIIKNTFNPEFKGTVILEKEPRVPFNIKGISSIDNISLLRISGSGMIGVPGISSRLFGSLAEKEISVILITQGSSEHTICIAVLPQYGDQAKEAIEKEFSYEIRDKIINEVVIEENHSVIAVVGEDFRNTPKVSGQVLQSLGTNGINIVAIAQGSSELNISIVIEKSHLKKALNVLHDGLFTKVPKTINMFVVGPGLVGGELLNLMRDEDSFIKQNLNLRLKLIGIGNSKKMLFDEKGIDFNNWKVLLGKSNVKMNEDRFFEKMRKLNLPNTIVVDSTAGNVWVPFYEKFLESNFSLVTPNKIANSGNFEYYTKLRNITRRNNAKFLYETNVCSAMPVIQNLKNLVANGDEILKIEGVLSGTLSYIFNSLKGDKLFSDIVLYAKEAGYTEPDPRDDLNGLDVARKLLILAREAGAKLELSDIKVENIIPKNLRGKKSVVQFMNDLKQADDYFENLKSKAAAKGNVLCYIAKYENGKASVAIEEIGKEHPFFGLNGNDNIVSITTKFNNVKPLTLSGRGAGARYTASGVLSDILRISNPVG